jgi:23S rRNA pseudouridine955/2504/2580 synthase
MNISVQAEQDDDGRRLDRIVRKAFPSMPISAIHRLLRKGKIMVNGVPCNGQIRVRAGDTINFYADNVIAAGRKILEKAVQPDTQKPDVIFENSALLAVNKPGGIVTHGPESLDTMVNAYLKNLLPPSLSFKPGPLHRLDRETSGVIVFSKSLSGAEYFSDGLRKGLFRKTYIALLTGELKDVQIWEDYIAHDEKQKKSVIYAAGKTGAKKARTTIVPIYTQNGLSLVTAEISTGRKHQIRAAAAAHKYPLYNDKKYNNGTGHFFLHSYSLEFPAGNPLGLPQKIAAPLPDRFISEIAQKFSQRSSGNQSLKK